MEHLSRMEANLHDVAPPSNEHSYGGKSAWNFNRERSTDSGNVKVHLGDLTDRLITFIKESEAVVGCVAWLTEPQILKALATVESAIVVQKEDFLRPDIDSGNQWALDLWDRYLDLHNEWDIHMFPGPMALRRPSMGLHVDPVRCVGNHNSNKRATEPKMHHKFLVRVGVKEETATDKLAFELGMGEPLPRRLLAAQSVWTGSFNFSRNAGRSFENAVEIHDAAIADAYLNEFSLVSALSEPLDWTTPWAAPEYWMGT